MMNTLLRAALIAAMLCSVSAAQAEVRTSISIGVGTGWYSHSAYRPYYGHHYYRPYPVYFGPTVTYYSSPPVYIAPAPGYTVYSAPVVSNAPVTVYNDAPVVRETVTVYDSQRPAGSPPVDGSGDWWYCHQPDGFYPSVKSCPAGWQRVPANR